MPMPAMISHYLFGEELMARKPDAMGDSRDEVDAFLLGNQGPDVFFFSYLDPFNLPIWGVGSRMHSEAPSGIVSSLLDAARSLPEGLQGIGMSYVAGMICHHALDSMMHPLIYAQQDAICDAGIEGLDERDGSEVHALIERDLDALALTKLRSQTPKALAPSGKLLPGSKAVLDIISSMYSVAFHELYGIVAPKGSFSSSVRAYRAVAKALYSPHGLKSSILGGVEKLFRRHSMVESMSQRDRMVHRSGFSNEGHCEWANPFTGQRSHDGFWDIFEYALEDACATIDAAMHDEGDASLSSLTMVDFNGKPTTAQIISIE